MSKQLLIIFTRNPVLGKVKTRLAKTVGDQTALDIYKFLLNYTVAITKNLKSDKAVYYSENIQENDLWDSATYQKKLQQGNDLGERMQQAFESAFREGYEKVMIIGSDLYDIQSQHIEKAFEELEKNEVVIGPAEDGGYYLLGMNTLIANAFKKKSWGTETVLKDTLNDLDTRSVALMKDVLNDIDVYEDIAHNDVFQPFLKQINT